MPNQIPPGGVSPASAFRPDTFADPTGPPVILADAFDVARGDFASLLDSYDPVDAAVIFTFATERSSGPAVDGVGHAFRTITHLDDSAPTLFDSLADEALRHLAEAGHVSRQPGDLELATDGAELAIEYRNEPERADRQATVR